MQNWYYQHEGAAQGPVSWQDLMSLVERGEVSPTDFVFAEGGLRWMPLKSLPEFERRSAQADDKREEIPRQPLPQNSSSPIEISPQDWFCLRREKGPDELSKYIQQGPFSNDDILSKLSSGELSFEDYLWRKGLPHWQRISDLDSFDRREVEEKKQRQEILSDVLEQDAASVPTRKSEGAFPLGKRANGQSKGRLRSMQMLLPALPLLLGFWLLVQGRLWEVLSDFRGERSIAVDAGNSLEFAEAAEAAEARRAPPPRSEVAPKSTQDSAKVHPSRQQESVQVRATPSARVAAAREEPVQPHSTAPIPAPQPTWTRGSLRIDLPERFTPQGEFRILRAPGDWAQVRFVGKTGEVLDELGVQRTRTVSAPESGPWVVSMVPFRLPEGAFSMEVRVGEERFRRDIFLGVRNREFRQRLQQHRKRISLEQQREKANLVRLSRDLLIKSEQLGQMIRQGQNPSSVWLRQLKGLTSPEIGRPGNLAYPEMWDSLSSYKKQLENLAARGTSRQPASVEVRRLHGQIEQVGVEAVRVSPWRDYSR